MPFQILEEVKRQVKDLDGDKYKVMLIWNPDTSEDVGWMVVRKDVQVDLSKFQTRDLNLKNLIRKEQVSQFSSLSQISENGEQSDKFEEGVASSSTVIEPGHGRNDVNKNNIDILTDKVFAHKQQLSSSSSNVDQAQPNPHWQKNIKRSCPECSLQVSHGSFVLHLRKAHKVELEKTRVRCDVCGISVRKFNLEFHKLVTHGRDVNVTTVEPLLFGQVEKVDVAVASSSIMGDSNHDHSIFPNDSSEINLNIMTDKVFVQEQLSSSHFSEHQASTDQTRAKWKDSIQRKCPKCGAQVSHGALLKHLQRVHSMEPEKTKVKCDECGYNVGKFNLEFHMLVNHGSKEEESKHKQEENLCEVESKFNESDSKITDFKIIYQDRHFKCSRSSTSTIRGALRRFCKQVGQDLVFKFNDEVVTGEEITNSFLGGVIFASGT